VLSLLACAITRHSQATEYLAGVPTPWMNRKTHAPWGVLADMRGEEKHIARLLESLVNPNLERRPAEVEDLRSYVARRDAEKVAAQDAGVEPVDGSSSEEGRQEKVDKLDKAAP
jgi:hypothetical protein